MTHIKPHGLIRPPPDPAPFPGAPPLVPGIRCWRTDSLGPVGRPGHGPLHTSVFALRVKPPRGVADASGFLSVFVRFVYERIALGSGKGRRGPYLPPTPGAWDVRIAFRPEPRPPGLRLSRPLEPRLSEAGPSRSPRPALTLLPIYTGLSQSLGGDPAPRAHSIGRRLCDVTACGPAPVPSFPELPLPESS